MKFNYRNNKSALTACSLTALFALASCSDATNLGQIEENLANGESATVSISTDDNANLVVGAADSTANDAAGGVFVMSNILDKNTNVCYSRDEDGTLTLVGEYSTGGLGGDFDGPEGLDPLISAYSLINTPDNEYLMAVNAGSDTISVMQINNGMSLDLVDTESTFGVGPNSLTYNDGLVYVTNIDADGEFAGEPDQEGSIYGYKFDNGDLNSTGKLRS